MKRALLLLCASFAQAACGCGSGAAPGEPIEVRSRPDGGFTTLLRGSRYDSARDVTVDGAGHTIVVGGTASPDFPTTEGAHQPRFAAGGTQLGGFGEMDVFVTRLRPDGSVLWSTFLGGPSYDRAYAVEVDAEDGIVVAGRAGAGFPTTPGALQTAFAGDEEPNPAYGPQDGFVAKLAPDGRLLWSTYLGDASMSFVRDIDLDPDGNVVAVLHGRGALPYVTPGAFQPLPGAGDDNAVVKLDASGARVLWATHLGRDDKEGEPSVRVDPQGRIFVLTSTRSDGWVPGPGAFQRERRGGEDLLLLRLSADGAVEARTYLGGSDDDVTETNHLALDPEGRPVLATATKSHDLPIPGDAAFQRRHGSAGYDGYVARLSPDLDRLLTATYIGHTGKSGGCEGVAVGRDGAVFTGGATGGGLPATPGALQPSFGGDRDAYLAKLAPDLSRALSLTYWGGPAHDNQRALRLGADGQPVSAGSTDEDVFVIRWPLPGAAAAGAR